MREFKNKFNLDGLVMPPKGVTVDTVKKVSEWVSEGKRGSFIAEARLKESLMSGDLANSVAHFINVITIPQLPDDKERPVAKLAGFRTVPDFPPATLFGLGFGRLEGPGVVNPQADFVGSAPRVPQGTPYPVATISGVESAYGKLAKRGLRINWDFEDFVNDTIGVLDSIPGELQQVALQTEWQEVGDALLAATTTTAAITLPNGVQVPANSKLNPNAIFAAIQQLALTRIHGNLIGTLSGYNVVVPVGQKIFADYQIRQALNIVSVVPGTAGGLVYGPPDNSILNTVEVIEHESITGNNWYLAPKPGAYRRPVLDILRLRGYETPQIRVRTDGSDGFSFDADTAAMRLRLVTGAALWFNEVVLHSTGANAAV